MARLGTPSQRNVVSLFPAATLLLLLLAQSATGQDTQCLYRYLKQPPSNILFDPEGSVPLCNPYSGTATVGVQCQVSVPDSVVAEILWFYEDQQISDTVGPTSSVQLVNSGDIITSTITFSGTSFSDMYRGSYHCQVVVDGNTDSTAPSNRLVLGTELSYITANPCMGQVLTEANNSCAGYGEATSPSPPESPPPSTTTLAGDMNVTDSNVTDPDPSGTTAAVSASEGTTASSTLEFTAEPDGSPLQLWVYVLVAIAAVFGMIIVVLAILCVGLCLKKNKTEDTYKHKGSEIKQFTSNSMVSNGLYQRKEEDGVTSGTHFSSHSQISDYNATNALMERDYEVIDMGEDKHAYHHLQRPSPPMLPGGRNGVGGAQSGRSFDFAPPTEFRSMSTLTSQIGGTVASREAFQQHGEMSRPHFLPAKSASEGPEDHVYRELEQAPSSAGPRLVAAPIKDIYLSPTDSDSPVSARVFNRDTLPTVPPESCVFGYPNESLYSPNFESSLSSRVQPRGLENVPETGTMFSEPANPTAFPVHKYEEISGKGVPEYETPRVTRGAKTVTSGPSLTLVNSGQASDGSRPRTNSSARYETELPVSTRGGYGTGESQYSKLVRPTDNSLSLSSATPLYSELGSQETNGVRQDKLQFSHSAAELLKRDFSTGSFHQMQDKAVFTATTMPPHVGVSGGVVKRQSSTSSGTDSLVSYIAQLDSEKVTVDMDGLLFSERDTRSSSQGSQGAGDVTARNNHAQQKRAWSEEYRREPYTSVMSRTGFSGSAVDSRSFGVPMSAPKIHKELRVNGIDSRVPELKTMV